VDPRATLGSLVADGAMRLGVERDARIVLAVSGGPDSIALLHGAASVAGVHGWRLHVGHLDHGLRRESVSDADFVAATASELALPCTVGRADVRALAAAEHRSMEDSGRRARYRFLSELAGEVGSGTWIATAHTADDQAETVLMRLVRGTGQRGLRGIPARRGHVIRPLLGQRRGRLREMVDALGLAYRLDATNADPAAASRNRVRAELLPLLERLNPGMVDALTRFANLAADDDTALDAMASAQLAGRRGVDGTLDWHDPPQRGIGRRVMRLAIGEPAPDASRIEALLDAAEGSRGNLTVELGGGRSAFVRGRRIAIGASGIGPASVLGQ